MPNGTVPSQDAKSEQDILDEQFREEDANSTEEAQTETEVVEESEETIEETQEESEEESQPSKERPIYTMPVSKAQEEKRKAVEKARLEAEEKVKAEYEAKIKDYESKLAQTQTTDEADEELAKFAEENNLDLNAAKGLMNIFSKKIKTPDLSRYDELVKKQEIEALRAEVLREFDEQVIPLIKQDYPSASEAHINKIKKEVEQLAFSKRFNTYPIADIYAVNRSKFKFKDSYTAEDSGGRTTDTDSIENLSEEEAMKLSPEEYVKWMDSQARGQSSFIDNKSD